MTNDRLKNRKLRRMCNSIIKNLPYSPGDKVRLKNGNVGFLTPNFQIVIKSQYKQLSHNTKPLDHYIISKNDVDDINQRVDITYEFSTNTGRRNTYSLSDIKEVVNE